MAITGLAESFETAFENRGIALEFRGALIGTQDQAARIASAAGGGKRAGVRKTGLGEGRM